MSYQILDEKLNSIANFLKYRLNFPHLADKIMSDVANSKRIRLYTKKY